MPLLATFIAGGSLYLFNLKGKSKGDEQDFMVEDSFHIDDAQKNIVILKISLDNANYL